MAMPLVLVHKLAPIHEGQGEKKERAGYSRLVGGRFNKQGNLPLRPVLSSLKTVDLCTHLPESEKCISKPKLRFSHIFNPDGLYNALLSQACILETCFHCVNGGRMHIPKTAEGVRVIAWVQLLGHPVVTSS